jgi:cupin fold WbuC family metalloprotein
VLNKLKINKFNEEVLFVENAIINVSANDITKLKQKAKINKRKRIRLCAHKNIDDSIHEMLIVHEKSCYVRPHMHINKTESFHIIEGIADVILFDDSGKIDDVIPMGHYETGQKFFYRLPASRYHTLLIQSEVLVFHEVTNGPFRQNDTVWASWSPEESDENASSKYMQTIMEFVENKLSF